MDDVVNVPAIKYYGLERDYTGKNEEWTKCGIIGADSNIPYATIRSTLDILENFRVYPIEDRLLWNDVFKEGRIIEFGTLCIAVKILCTK
jgi:hypothetical protein